MSKTRRLSKIQTYILKRLDNGWSLVLNESSGGAWMVSPDNKKQEFIQLRTLSSLESNGKIHKGMIYIHYFKT